MVSTLDAHLKTGSTTVCRAWRVRRKDGVVLGFADHDEDLTFEGVMFAARTGLTARALEQSTGMAVDNSEAFGALSDAAINEEDIQAGRYDDAEVTIFMVNWADVEQRDILFRGTFGEITRKGGAFSVELRGLAERLNIPTGKVYHPDCNASLGDDRCGIDLLVMDRTVNATLLHIDQGRVLIVPPYPHLPDGWFAHGLAMLTSGTGHDQVRFIRRDHEQDGGRVIELWQPFGLFPAPGDTLRLTAGCDKSASACKAKFGNFLNFRGFPHVPGDDWLRSNPARNR